MFVDVSLLSLENLVSPHQISVSFGLFTGKKNVQQKKNEMEQTGAHSRTPALSNLDETTRHSSKK